MPKAKRKSARQVFLTGRPTDFDTEHIVEIVENLYKLKLAHAFFVGMGWPEGYNYCVNSDYVRLTVFPAIFRKDDYGYMDSANWRPYWFACRFLED
ncbi:MAG TPA: hypothetical protein PLP33_24495 [Leptospiraceae bacterium]|nr:hypothetical protein [Leptospiraceae bacterium]